MQDSPSKSCHFIMFYYEGRCRILSRPLTLNGIPNGGEFELSVRPLSRVKPNPLYGLETLTHGAIDPNQPQFGASKDTEA
jgi:hypothetical protein